MWGISGSIISIAGEQTSNKRGRTLIETPAGTGNDIFLLRRIGYGDRTATDLDPGSTVCLLNTDMEIRTQMVAIRK